MSRRAVGVVICGMGRSGTSAVAGLFASSGYYVARDEDLMPASPSNPVGYHENLRIWKLNERVLDALGGSWFAPPRDHMQIEARSRFAPEVQREFDALLAESGSAPLALKDPRIGVMSLLWDPIIGETLHPVVVVRDPVEIARSLAQRDRTPMAFALASWEIHMTSTLRWLQGRAVTIVRYERVLASASAARALIADATDQLHESRAAAVTVCGGEDWLDPGLRHHNARQEEYDELLTSRQHRLWSWLAAMDDGTRSLTPPEELTTASASAHAAVAQEQLRAQLAHRALVSAEEVSALTMRLREMEGQIRLAEQERVRLSQAVEEQRARADATLDGERQARDQLAVVVGSRSWRLTSPARRAARIARSS
jgi:hypothetical protein